MGRDDDGATRFVHSDDRRLGTRGRRPDRRPFQKELCSRGRRLAVPGWGPVTCEAGALTRGPLPRDTARC